MYQYNRPNRPTKPKTPVLLYISLAVVLVISAGFIINHVYSEYVFRHGAGHTHAQVPEPDQHIPVQLPSTPSPAPSGGTVVLDAEPAPPPEPAYDPAPTPPPRVQRQEFLDYRAHYGNDGIIGRLRVPNTSIDYIIPQTTDNVFYKYHDIRGRSSIAGWVWLCAYADIHGQDQNLVLFGHNMARNEKFHAIRYFLDPDFFASNRYIYFSTIYADYVFEVFSVYVTHIDWPYIFSNYCHIYGGWAYYIGEFANRSLFDAGIEVSENDRVLTLSTCDNVHIDYRIAVHARLVSETFPHIDDDLPVNDGTDYI